MGKFAAWLLGVLSGVVILGGTEAALLAFLPSKTYLNSWGTQIVGEDLGNKGLLAIVQNVNDVKFGDVPILESTLKKALEGDSDLGGMVSIDFDAIRGLAFTDPDLANKIQAAVKITATLSSLKINLGNFGKLSIFKEWTPITPTAEQIDQYYQVLYYQSGSDYLRAYDDAKQRVAASEGKQLYLPDLSKIPVDGLFVGLSARLGEVTYPEFMKALMGMSESELASDTVYKIVGNAPLKDLANLDVNDVHLVDVLKKNAENAELYDLLLDLVDGASTAEDITIGDLSTLDIGKAHLTTFIPYSGNKALYDVLCDMAGKSHDQYATLTLGALKTISVNNVKLSTLISDDGGNSIIASLLAKDSTVGSLSADINTLSVAELFGESCFTHVKADAMTGREADKYKIVDGKYVYDNTLSDAEAYYISENAGVWLLFAYDASDVYASTGRANTFAPANATFTKLQDDPTSFSSKVGDSTIYQLLSAGLISGDYPTAITSKTLNQVLASI